MYINNTSSILQKSLQAANSQQIAALKSIAAGKQTTAMENAANLALSEALNAQERGTSKAYENVQAGMNMLNVAEGNLSSTHENLQRINELTIQASNGTLGDTERNIIKTEIESLVAEIDRTAESATFNDIKLLDGSSSDLKLQTGANATENDTTQVGDSLSSAKAADIGLTTDLDTVFSSSENITAYLDEIKTAIDQVSSQRAEIGAQQNTLASTADSLQVTEENLAASKSILIDTNIAQASSDLIHSNILSNTSSALMAQANQSPTVASMLLGFSD